VVRLSAPIAILVALNAVGAAGDVVADLSPIRTASDLDVSSSALTLDAAVQRVSSPPPRTAYRVPELNSAVLLSIAGAAGILCRNLPSLSDHITSNRRESH